MIICPSCKEEIEEESHYCDQCGQELVYCSSCGRVGMGRRCTYCGGLMVGPEGVKEQRNVPQSGAADNSSAPYTYGGCQLFEYRSASGTVSTAV